MAAIKMDTLRLQKYQRQGSLIDKETNSLKKVSGKKNNFHGNTTLTNKGLVKSEAQFLEYFVNDKPLSELLDNFYNSKTTILENWIGALGTNSKTDIIKVKQLIGKEVSDKEIRQVYPSAWTDDEFSWYLEKYREELKKTKVLIYCCAECGDYDCGGIAVTIDKTDSSVTWTIKEGDKALRFEFDKYSYFEVFNNYLRIVAK
ncbi:MAG: hypothetical protein KF862_14760 [Chitinophagaceae bacterium]|nr:hypothetical protein [Chitinophagaceae bacterium]